MKFTKKEDEFGKIVTLEEGDKTLSFSFGGNLDLYWKIHNKNGKENYNYDYFTITKENYGVYRLFEMLFYDMENMNVFDIDMNRCIFMDEDEIDDYIRMRQKEIEEEKRRCREYNHSYYNDLYDTTNQVITWYSDETANEVSNILKISKLEDSFKVEFFTQPHIYGYDEDFHTEWDIPIRFRNSGSSYEPFHTLFMKMYNALDEVDDFYDVGHQIHIEEYLYHKQKVKIKEHK